MIKIENVEVVGWEPALRGMRNAFESWDKSDSSFWDITPQGGMLPAIETPCLEIGPNDLSLALKLAKAGGSHAKYRRMIVAYADITAPLYYWKEFETYKVGTVSNSCSTMNRIHSKKFVMSDFSYDLLIGEICDGLIAKNSALNCLRQTVAALNDCREKYLENPNKINWYQLIQLLPSSYNQKRTIMLNYEVLSAMYRDRKNHKLDEWRDFCKWIETLPYSELITCNSKECEHE